MLQKNDWRIMSQDSYIHGRSFKKNVFCVVNRCDPFFEKNKVKV